MIINSEGFVLNIQFLECYKIVVFRLCENIEEQAIYIIGVCRNLKILLSTKYSLRYNKYMVNSRIAETLSIAI